MYPIIVIVQFQFKHNVNQTECFDALPKDKYVPYEICHRTRYPYDHYSMHAQNDAFYEDYSSQRRGWYVNDQCKNPLVLGQGSNVPVYHRLSPAIQLTITVNNEEHHYRYTFYCFRFVFTIS